MDCDTSPWRDCIAALPEKYLHTYIPTMVYGATSMVQFGSQLAVGDHAPGPGAGRIYPPTTRGKGVAGGLGEPYFDGNVPGTDYLGATSGYSEK